MQYRDKSTGEIVSAQQFHCGNKNLPPNVTYTPANFEHAFLGDEPVYDGDWVINGELIAAGDTFHGLYEEISA